LLTTILVMLWSAPALVTFMGATNDSYRDMALEYINPLFYGTIFFITVQMLQAILNTLGRTQPGRNFLIAGFFLNLVLDPWFIFGGFGLPAMGIMGIALATVLTQILGCFYIGYEVSRTDLISWASLRRYWRPDLGQIWRIIQQGFPNTVDTMGVSLGFFILTIFVGRFGQHAVAAMGSASRIEQVFFLPLLGTEHRRTLVWWRGITAPSKLPARVHETFRMSIIVRFGDYERDDGARIHSGAADHAVVHR
jgi:Na+-driven multidrug efflux pump